MLCCWSHAKIIPMISVPSIIALQQDKTARGLKTNIPFTNEKLIYCLT